MSSQLLQEIPQSWVGGDKFTRITIYLAVWLGIIDAWNTKKILGKNEIEKFLSTAAKNAGVQQEGKRVTTILVF